MKPGDLVKLASNCWFCNEPGSFEKPGSEVIIHPMNEVGIILESRELGEECEISPQMWHLLLIPTRGFGWVHNCVLELLNETG